MNLEELRRNESDSIWSFLNESRKYMHGDLLDFGSGAGQYAKLALTIPDVEWHLFDRAHYPASLCGDDVGDRGYLDRWDWNTIVCTQVVQYVPNLLDLLRRFRFMLKKGGHLIMTYPTHWPIIENEDLWRYTKAGMEAALWRANFDVVVHEQRHSIDLEDFSLPIGYGVVAS